MRKLYKQKNSRWYYTQNEMTYKPSSVLLLGLQLLESQGTYHEKSWDVLNHVFDSKCYDLALEFEANYDISKGDLRVENHTHPEHGDVSGPVEDLVFVLNNENDVKYNVLGKQEENGRSVAISILEKT